MTANYTLTIVTKNGQREIGFNDARTALATINFYADNKRMFNIVELILVDEDALKMVTA